jgi:hypothetical protein
MKFANLILSVFILTATDQYSQVKSNLIDRVNPESILVDDFLVNDDVAVGRSEQRNPSIAIDANNNFIIAYQEKKHGNWEVYFQRFNSSGIALGNPVKCSDNPVYGERWYPSIEIDGTGNFFVIWTDYYHKRADIFFQRFNSSGIKQGNNVKVNDAIEPFEVLTDNLSKLARMAISSTGNFVITWSDARNGSNLDIYFQRYNSLGDPQGINQKANSDVGTTNQTNPSIAIDNTGNYIITWTDMRNGNEDIYFQRYNSSGTAVGVNTKVNNDAGTRNQFKPSITTGANGNFNICWIDNRNGVADWDYDLYLQQYNNNATAVGSNTKVNDQNYVITVFSPFIKTNINGDFIVAWLDERREALDLYMQIYNSSGVLQGANRRISDDNGGYQMSPSIAFGTGGEVKIVWQDVRQSDFNIYMQSYNSQYISQGNNIKIIDDLLGTADQYQPSISNNGNNSYVVSWYDDRTYSWNPFFQRINSSGVAQGTNQNATNAVQYGWEDVPNYIASAMDVAGDFIITWEDRRAVYSDVYFQKYFAQGTLNGSNVKVNNDVGTTSQFSPAIALTGNGNFYISWVDGRNNDYDIYFQRYDFQSTMLGTNTKANDDVGGMDQVYPQIAADESGNFTIVWEDYRNGNADIYLRRFNSSGIPLGSSVKVNDNTGTSKQSLPVIAMDRNGNVVVVWNDSRNGNYDIYSQRYNSSGVAQGANQKINDINSDHRFPKIAIAQNGNYVITWTALVNNLPDIYAQRFSSNGTKIGGNTLIVAQATDRSKGVANVSVSNNNVFFAWMDNRRQSGWDIYSKILTWSWGDVPSPAIPQTPSNLIAVTFNSSQINLSWQDNDVNELGYKVERKIGSSGTWTEIASLPVNSTSYWNTNLIDGTLYYYRVYAYNNGGISSYSDETNATTWIKAPTNLAATAISPSQINLTWTDNSNSETSYVVQRRLLQTDPFTQIAVLPPNTQSYSDQNLQNYTCYYYRVVVENANATGYSSDTYATTFLEAPTNLVASAVTNTQIDLSWTDNSPNENGFKIEKKTGTTGTWSEIASVSTNTNKYSNTNLTENTQYFYRVRAYSSSYFSNYSNEANATTTINIPQAPSDLSAIASFESNINLTWKDNSTDETGFKIERKTTGAWTFVTATSANTISLLTKAPFDGGLFYYRVYAYNFAGNSNYSNEVSVITPFIAPSNLTATAISPTHIRLTWIDGSANKSAYAIERKIEGEPSFTKIAEMTAYVQYYNNTDLTPNTTYYYRIKTFNTVTESEYSNEAFAKTPPIVSVEEINSSIPAKYYLSDSYPNPFNMQTTIEFGLPQSSAVSVTVFDISGRAVADLFSHRVFSAGKYRVVWNGTNTNSEVVPSGIYFIRMNAFGGASPQSQFSKTLKLVLMK